MGKPVQTTLQSLVPVRIIKSFLSVLRSRSKVQLVGLVVKFNKPNERIRVFKEDAVIITLTGLFIRLLVNSNI